MNSVTTRNTLAPRVCLASSPDCTGRLVQAGPCQSVVRWDNGNEVVVVNSWVKEIDDAPGALDRAGQRPPGDRGADRKPRAAPMSAAYSGESVAPRPIRKPPPDDLARRLKDCEPRRLEQFARLNGVWDERYAKLPNPGLVRMNIINRLRAKMKKGHEIKWPR